MVHKIHMVGYRLIHFKSVKFLTAINRLIINIPNPNLLLTTKRLHIKNKTLYHVAEQKKYRKNARTGNFIDSNLSQFMFVWD